MTLDYDFWIGAVGSGLGFNTAISKDRPYQRATAQFRKDQLDAAATVGDQSLTGWWTRGQLSFHRGSGVKYYEVLDGETVFNRFQDSSGVDPWTPGELTLASSSSDIALTGIVDAVGATYGGDEGVLALLDDGTMRFVDSAVGATVVSGHYREILSITSSGIDAYVATEESIESPSAATHDFFQEVKNPYFKTSGTVEFTHNTGSYAVAYGVNGASGGMSVTYIGPTPVANGGAEQVFSLTAGRDYRLRVKIQSGSVGILVNGVIAGTATPSNEVDFTFTADGSDDVNLGINTTTVVERITITDLIDYPDIPTKTANPSDWTGTEGTAHQRYRVEVGDPWDLWFPPSGRTWARIWWAKGRLFALDDEGKWYTLSTVGGTADEVDDVFWAPNLGVDGWSLAESPGAIYISRGSEIYAINLDTDGLLPTITTPVVAASFPTGENISTTFSYVGRLVACTNLGLRVAVVQSDGSLAYGPHAVEGDFSDTQRVTALRDLAYVVGIADGDTDASVFAVNMLAEIDDLQPVWAKLAPMDAGTLLGAVITPDEHLMAWDGDGFYRTGSGLQDEGYVTTGFHRLGTLDPKSFQYLRVKTEGTTGDVVVSALLPDGTETEVGTVAAGGSADLSLTTAVPAPAEYIALKFTLSGDGTDGPVLLGYQLKALPVPKRQRMIRVPLLLFDREQSRSGQTMVFNPWDRLAALEALEVSNAVVSFTDTETTETGDAYIESVEVDREAPAARGHGGFGGIVWVVLRKL